MRQIVVAVSGFFIWGVRLKKDGTGEEKFNKADKCVKVEF